MPVTLHNANALVTGASRGLGRHIAIALANEGANVHLVARSPKDLEATKQLIGDRATCHTVDVRDHAALSALAGEVDVDVLVNNAGIEHVAYLHDLPIAMLQSMIDVNLTSAIVLTRMVIRGMLDRRRGHIVNIASLAGKTGPPLAETYAVTKAGLIAFTQSLRASYAGTGVSASVVCPGYIRGEGMFADRAAKTGHSPPRLIGTSPPEEVGRAVVRVIQRDEPERLVTPTPARLFAAIGQIQPRFPGWLLKTLKLRDLYEAQRDNH